MKNRLVFATRPSRLARWQTEFIRGLLQPHWPDLVTEEIVITTQGDKVLDRALPEIGGKGLFTTELEDALRNKEVDVAVHSIKDLPVDDLDGLIIAAIPERAPVHDVLISPAGYTLETLPAGAVIGTSSLRREAQILAIRPDLKVKSIRGNVDTRIRKTEEGLYDAIVLAAAGVTRLGLTYHITQDLTMDMMLPAPGQGALAIQCRLEDSETQDLLSTIHNTDTFTAVTAERTFLQYLGGGCSLPVGAYAKVIGGVITINTIVISPDGQHKVKVMAEGNDPHDLGKKTAETSMHQGAERILNVQFAK